MRSIRRVSATVMQGRWLHTSSALLQAQHPHIETATHGAGYIRHDAQFSKDPSVAKAADLVPTDVEHGLGTGAADPYHRTLPNMDLRPAESTTLSSAMVTAPTLDEVATLHKRSGSLGYWFGEQHPRMPKLLATLQTRPAHPLPLHAADHLKRFASDVIGQLAQSYGTDASQAALTWGAAVRKFEQLPLHLFQKEAFESALNGVVTFATTIFRDQSPAVPEELQLAVEMLRRDAVLRRNRLLDQLIYVSHNATALSNGEHLWQLLRAEVQSMMDAGREAELFPEAERNENGLRFIWENLPTTAAPLLTAPAAMFALLVSFGWSKGSLSNGGAASPPPAQGGNTMDTIPFMTRRKLALQILQRRQKEGTLISTQFAEQLRALGLTNVARRVELSAAASTGETKAAEEDAKKLAYAFQDPTDVQRLLVNLLSFKDDAVPKALYEALGLPRLGRTDAATLYQDSQWNTHYEAIVIALLSNDVTASAIRDVVNSQTRTKQQEAQASKAQEFPALFTTAFANKLSSMKDSKEQRLRGNQKRIEGIIRDLSSNETVNKILPLLEGESLLADEAKRATDAIQKARSQVPPEVLSSAAFGSVYDAMTATHPNWVQSTVLPSAPLREATGSGALRTLLRVYVRSVYVPHAGSALLAQRLRGRIGPVGTALHQHNLPVEVGMVEKYDNLQHKRYDWQGWYQRMVDVHNRNISLRVKLTDLKTLDAQGRPFLDMQSERRLRIVAKDKVGMSILKLDSDRYEDQSDNYTFGATKVSQLLQDARKTMLGKEYVPTVEVKVRRPSGQSKMQYSVMDYDRIERRSTELYAQYREAKKRSFFVSPTDTWLEVRGLQVRRNAEVADADGYSVDGLFSAMSDGNETPSTSS